MITEKLDIFGNDVWLVIDSLKVDTENGIEEKENQFLCFYKRSVPTEVSFGELFKDEENETIIFESIQASKNYAISTLSKSLYPLLFKDPLNYNKENLAEIMHKDLIIEISATNESDNITEVLEGKIVSCMLAGNPPFLPASVKIQLNDGTTRESDFFEMRKFRRPQ